MRELMISVIQRSLIGVESLPPKARADFYEGLALLATRELPDIAATARTTAEALREAEQHQLTFAALLRTEAPAA